MNAVEVRRASWRLGAQTALLLFACVVLVGITVFVVVDRSAMNFGEQQLRTAARAVDKPSEAPRGVMLVIERDGERIESPGLPDGFPIEADLRATAADGRARQRRVDLDGDHYLVRTERVGDRVNQAIYDEEEYEAERNRLLSALVIAGGVGILGALLAGFVLARRSLRPLAETMALQRRFIADASHELRTPLTLLSTRVQLLARRLRRAASAEPEVEGELDGVLSDARRLGEILEDLLLAADPRSVQDPVGLELGDLSEEVLASVRASSVERGIEVVLRRDGDAPVAGSETSLRRAVVALIDNALDHAVQRIEVVVRSDRRWSHLEVTDDGPGIAEDVLPRLFERFASSRPEATGHRHYGLGLALVADIAHAHGGRVGAENVGDQPDPDRPAGARLRLSLPRDTAPRG